MVSATLFVVSSIKETVLELTKTTLVVGLIAIPNGCTAYDHIATRHQRGSYIQRDI
jgi:hypothetical protein